jgi:hypothetical protein
VCACHPECTALGRPLSCRGWLAGNAQEQFTVESTFKASSASWPTTEYHIGFSSSTNGAYLVWYAADSTYAGNGAASNVNSSSYYHWDSTSTVNQGACASLGSAEPS